MRAQFVNENIRFERGQDPKYSMGIGDWSIKRALLDQNEVHPGDVEYDAQRDWWTNGGIPREFLTEVGYQGDPSEFIGFDEDYYMESELPEEIDADEFMEDFSPVESKKSRPNTNGWGTFQWLKGELPDGSVIYHYVDGMGSGFIARKDQLK